MASFVDSFLKAQHKVIQELDKHLSTEEDVRQRIVDYIVRGVWGYDGKDFHRSIDRRDPQIAVNSD